MRKKTHLIGMTAFVLAVVAVQLLASACHREYYLTQLIVAAYYSIVALGLCLVMGYAGQISLGHGAFFAIGGYTSAVLTTLDLGKLANTDFGQLLCRLRFLVPRQDLYGGEFVGVSPPAAFVIAILLTVVTALAIGYPALRLKGHYLAMATLGFGLIVYRILVGSEFTGGADGISSVPNWHLLPGLVICEKNGMRLQNYYFAWVVVGVTLIFILKLVNSRV
ncbi:MAG: branched-chain amino acid ABC transporter permease, partial [Lentisphaeria bacterium]|nr:branched-chain amino acid ABC transporter permease [Lentisphaeria bacterium]